MLILVINPGATSTKLSIFKGKEEVFRTSIDHPCDQLEVFEKIIDQFSYRLDFIKAAIRDAGYSLSDFAAVCSRGGLLRHIPSGTYKITDRAIADVENPPYGEHASNLGVVLARAIADPLSIPAFFVDPVSVDELSPVARVTGYAGMERESFFHALNQKAVARKAAEAIKRPYEECNLIVVHMGGGVSVAAHQKGKVVDVNNVKDEGAFAMDRGGSLPVNALIKLCFSGLTIKEVKKLIGVEAGVYSYLKTRDFREVVALKDAGDERAALIFQAFIYQLCKDVGAMAAVMDMEVDAIALTGGIAYSKLVEEEFNKKVSKIAPILVFPGEEEMEALAMGAYRVLTNEISALEY